MKRGKSNKYVYLIGISLLIIGIFLIAYTLRNLINNRIIHNMIYTSENTEISLEKAGDYGLYGLSLFIDENLRNVDNLNIEIMDLDTQEEIKVTKVAFKKSDISEMKDQYLMYEFKIDKSTRLQIKPSYKNENGESTILNLTTKNYASKYPRIYVAIGIFIGGVGISIMLNEYSKREKRMIKN